jgi:hypothetical protein
MNIPNPASEREQQDLKLDLAVHLKLPGYHYARGSFPEKRDEWIEPEILFKAEVELVQRAWEEIKVGKLGRSFSTSIYRQPFIRVG